MANELFETTRPWFQAAFDRHAAEMPELGWELSFAHLPNPEAKENEPRMTSVMVLYVQHPTGNGAQHVVNTILISSGFDEQYVDNLVADAAGSISRRLAELQQGFVLPEADLRAAGVAP